MSTISLNKFSAARFWAVTKRDATLNWKSHLAHFLELAGALLAGLLIIMLSAKVNSWHTSFGSIADTFYSWFSLVLFAGSCIAASTLLKPICDKPGSIDYLTLPATNVEKYLSRAVLVTVGFTLSAIVALVVVEILYYPLVAVFGLDAYGSLTYYCTKAFFAPEMPQVVLNDEIGRSVFEWQGKLMTWGFLLWSQSLFLLGGAVWRKFAFVKTLGVAIGLMLLSSFLSVWAWHPQSRMEFASTFPTVLAVTGAVFVTLTIANWMTAYWLFTRKQVVEIKSSRL